MRAYRVIGKPLEGAALGGLVVYAVGARDVAAAHAAVGRLPGARLVGTRIWSTRFTGARLCGAAMRTSELTGCALEGADFSDAALNEASLRACTLDDATRVTGAFVWKWGVDPGIAERIVATGGVLGERAGATLGQRQDLFVSELDGVIASLGGSGSTDPLVLHLIGLRPKVVADPSYPWGNDAIAAFPHARSRIEAALKKAHLHPWALKR